MLIQLLDLEEGNVLVFFYFLWKFLQVAFKKQQLENDFLVI